MGSWGNEIFESDTASECVSRVVTIVARELESDLNSLDDGVLERPAPACVAMLNALANTAALDVSIVVPVERASQWRIVLREWFERVQASEKRDAEDWKQLAEAVDREFAELIQLLAAVE